MLAAELPFKDKLAPKKICSDMMILSSLITDYDKKDSIMLSESLPVNLVLETYAVYTQTDTQAMIVVCEEKKYAAVVFRGTKGDSLRDWQVNMSYKKVHFDLTGAPSDVMVHEGYWNAAVVGIGQSEGFENTLLDLMTKYDLDMIYVTGYSMGGSCAQVFGTYLAAKHDHLKVRVVSFGQTKVGNQSFRTWTQRSGEFDHNLSVFRFVNRNDIVPRLSVGRGYKSAGHLFQIEKRKSVIYYSQQADQGEEYKIPPFYWKYGMSIRNHYIDEYLNFFDRKAGKKKFWPISFAM